MDMDFIVSA